MNKQIESPFSNSEFKCLDDYVEYWHTHDTGNT